MFKYVRLSEDACAFSLMFVGLFVGLFVYFRLVLFA